MHLKIKYVYPFNYVQTNNWFKIELLALHRNIWSRLTVYKQISSDSFKNCYLQTICLQIIFDEYVLAQWVVCSPGDQGSIPC